MLKTLDRVRIVVANELYNATRGMIDPSTIEATTHLVEELDVDSLDIVQIAMGIEEEFDIDLEEHEMEQFHTVQDIVNLIETKKGA